jgi:phosphotransferase system enzyme I (PtsI)
MSGSQKIIHGVAVSGGIITGHAVRAFDPQFISFNFKLKPEQVEAEAARFDKSVDKSRQQLRRMQRQLQKRSGPESSFLIDAHLLILQDKLFVDRIRDKIQADQINAEWAIQEVSDELFQAYDKLEDEYLRERRGDLDDIVRRLLHNLQTNASPALQKLPYDAILVGRAIPPSILFELRSQRIVGLITETGSPLSHTAIMARSLEIPAVMGAGDLSGILPGELVILDGDSGAAICDPSRETLEQYKPRLKTMKRPARRATAVPAPALTMDGVRISLGANINFREEVQTVLAAGCESIGLYRTEFDFFREGHQPGEDQLVAEYSDVLKTAKNIPVTFRTIDVGIDQKSWDGVNSNLGVRGLRFCLENQDIFRTQLRALYRSSVYGKTRILLPFVSTLDDLDAAREIIDDVKQGLIKEGLPFDAQVPIGVMIETPAAAQTCDLMASQVDFFCLGTNDLIQYYLVVDRSDQSVMHLYNPFHPAILRCLNQVYTLLQPTGKLITVCGEMAADPPSAAILLGLGFTSLSVSIPAFSRIQQMIRAVSFSELRGLAQQLLRMQKPKDVEERIRAAVNVKPL